MDTRPLVISANGHGEVVLPSLARMLLSVEEKVAREKLLAGQYFLVSMRLGNLGEIFRCGRCNGKHERLTKYCIDRPFCGLDGSLFAYLTTVEEAAGLGILPPQHAARIEAIRRLFSPVDLADSHPGLARQLSRRRESDPLPVANGVDIDVGMVALGVLERVEPRDAQRLVDRINTRAALYQAPPLVVPGLAVRR